MWKSVKTLSKAIEFRWKRDEIEELVQRLDRIRTLLYSEVMLNIQQSVAGIQECFQSTGQLLEDMSNSQFKYHKETKSELIANRLAAGTLLQDQSLKLNAMDAAANSRHELVLQAISGFTEVLKEHILFPALPKVVVDTDPSLKSAALTNYETIENAILASLWFRTMNIRECQVKEAYRNTCSWIFQDPKAHQKPWSNFRKWLEQERGCYWISGKAGCGKSTLMKYIIGDPRTQNALMRWTGSKSPLTASYFFWMAGTWLQKNQEGLLRSLLHSILAQRRDLIAKVFPSQYSAMITRSDGSIEY